MCDLQPSDESQTGTRYGEFLITSMSLINEKTLVQDIFYINISLTIKTS